MRLEQVEIQQVRNLSAVSIEPVDGINVIYGPNASGKTSLLEAIHILGHARSFRTTHIDQLVQHNQEYLRVVGRIQTPNQALLPIGIERSKHQTTLRINGQAAKRSSQLAQYLPLQVIHPDIHQLLSQGPKYRRQFLDWGVFHVEPSFLSVWQQFHRVLRQRNAALRADEEKSAITVWDQALVEHANEITRLRQNYLDQITPLLQGLTQRLIGLSPHFEYYCGWTKQQTYAQALERGLSQDKLRGFTQFGPHRADLKIKVAGVPVQNHFSRGQQKLFVSAMRLAQVAHLKQHKGVNSLLLVDDLAAELDSTHRALLLELLLESKTQLFITTTESKLLDIDAWPEAKMFHVKHGQVTEMV